MRSGKGEIEMGFLDTSFNSNDYNKIHELDCFDGLVKLNDINGGLIKCIVTSPPYNLGGDFHTFVDGKRVTYGDYKSPYDDKMSEKEYQNWQLRFLDLCYEALENDGVMFYNHKNRIVKGSVITPFDWIQKSKFNIYQVVVLDFGATANVDKRRFFPVHELLFVLTKNNKTKLKNINNLTDVWKMKKVPRKKSGHPATFHTDLPLRCIQASTDEGDLVCDPFAGTGTTLVVAKELNRNFIGFEVSKDYIEITNKRLNN
jgi:site-specific DNA-methyltransferase (adenine-specific)